VHMKFCIPFLGMHSSYHIVNPSASYEDELGLLSFKSKVQKMDVVVQIVCVCPVF
jgi:hypothetical protein